MAKLHEAFCACCSGGTATFHRRQFIRAVGIGGATLAFAPYLALAAEGNYEAMVLACIDPRMQEPVHRYTVEQNLTGKFSQFVIAGAAIGVVAPAFKDWHQAFWDNLATTSSCTASGGSSPSTIAIAVPQGSPMARRKSQPRRRKLRHTGRRSQNSASKSGSATRSLGLRPASWPLTARWRCSAEATGVRTARRLFSSDAKSASRRGRDRRH
jgi:hypothetical protein